LSIKGAVERSSVYPSSINLRCCVGGNFVVDQVLTTLMAAGPELTGLHDPQLYYPMREELGVSSAAT
jgi:hypothetical protein